MKKGHPERVISELAIKALDKASINTAVYSEYIILHFRFTGKLAPGCDARDLIAWCEQNEQEKWQKLMRKQEL